MCLKRRDVTFDPDAGPVMIDVDAGFATKGKYRASIRLEDGWHEFGAGDVADDIPDVLLVPLDGDDLVGKRVLIVGKYAPADISRGTQIKVDYDVRQGAAQIASESIEREKAGVLLCSHTFTFKEAES